MIDMAPSPLYVERFDRYHINELVFDFYGETVHCDAQFHKDDIPDQAEYIFVDKESGWHFWQLLSDPGQTKYYILFETTEIETHDLEWMCEQVINNWRN